MGPKFAGGTMLSNAAEYATFMTGLWTPRCPYNPADSGPELCSLLLDAVVGVFYGWPEG